MDINLTKHDMTERALTGISIIVARVLMVRAKVHDHEKKDFVLRTSSVNECAGFSVQPRYRRTALMRLDAASVHCAQIQSRISIAI